MFSRTRALLESVVVKEHYRLVTNGIMEPNKFPTQQMAKERAQAIALSRPGTQIDVWGFVPIASCRVAIGKPHHWLATATMPPEAADWKPEELQLSSLAPDLQTGDDHYAMDSLSGTDPTAKA
jgi:hypothetical protein